MYWIPASEPGTGHGVSMFFYTSENCAIDPSQFVWEQLQKKWVTKMWKGCWNNWKIVRDCRIHSTHSNLCESGGRMMEEIAVRA